MRAVVATAAGGPDVLEVQDRDDPTPAPGQLLVRVAAAGVNFMDIYGREGRRPYAGTPPWVPGAEGAGTVVAVAEGVAGWAVGEAAAWASAPGSYAELALVDAARAVHVPPGVDPQVAAAVMLQGITAHYLCHSTHPVAAGEVVVVHAAAGGVGLLLTQMAKMRGGVVVATTSGGDKAEAARRAGADESVGYEELGAVVGRLGDGAGAGAVYDGVGAATFDASLAALRPRGCLVLYGAASGPVPPFELTRLMAGGSLYVTRPTMGDYISTRDELEWRAGDLLGWVADGRLAVTIGGRYPLEAAPSAQADLAGRRTSGKLLLVP
ncbi:MAG: quinone oxidoreductase family protein [Acidimicrobiales bacterium]